MPKKVNRDPQGSAPPTRKKRPARKSKIENALIIPGGITVGEEEPDLVPPPAAAMLQETSPILDRHVADDVPGRPRQPRRESIAIQPPTCPACGCHHCPPYERKTLLRGRVLVRHECRHCGRRFARMLPAIDVVQSGAK